MGDKLERRLEVVKEGVEVSKEDLDFTTGLQEVCDFDHGHKVTTVWAAGGGSSCMGGRKVSRLFASLVLWRRERGGGQTPVDLDWAILLHDDILNDVLPEDLLEASRDQFDLLSCCHFHHCCSHGSGSGTGSGSRSGLDI